MSSLKIILFLSIFPYIFGIGMRPTTEELVVVTDTTPENLDSTTAKIDEKEGNYEGPPKISDLYIHSNITNRFANTIVRSKVKNHGTKAQQTTFFVIIPDQAFISSFTMEIGGKNYTAYVEEKDKAKNTYDQAVASGIGAAHVAVSARDSNKFTVNVNVEPESKAVFYLTYEELLERKDGLYEQVINIHPKQLVKNLNVEVDIEEIRPLTNVRAPPIRSGNEIGKESEALDPRANIEQTESNKASIKFTPDYERQKQIANGMNTKEDEGIAGQFVVQYDVERDPNGGEVLIKDGHFVHFFAPDNLPVLNKHVVFVLDTSGSMYNRKLEQLKTAMKSILGELNSKDFFNLVEFNTNVKIWNLDAPSESTIFPHESEVWYNEDKTFDLTDISFPPAYPVNNNTIKKANKAVEDMYSTGGTNIYEALRVGIHLIKLRQRRTNDKNAQPLIVFLTDGDPTVGKTNTQSITSDISEENTINIPIISLSFGDGADKNFLQKISLKNHGFARHIYEDSDASLQLENIYKLISSPLLHDVKFTYTPDSTSLTKTNFPILFHGSEFVISGELPSKEFSEAPKVSAWGINGPIDFVPRVSKISVGQLERLWAYMTVNKYLDAREVSENATEYTKKALDLALKYSFVTPVTSLVVVKPNATDAINTEAADTNVNNYADSLYSAARPALGAPTLGAAGFSGGFAAGGVAGPPAPAPAFALKIAAQAFSLPTTPAIFHTTHQTPLLSYPVPVSHNFLPDFGKSVNSLVASAPSSPAIPYPAFHQMIRYKSAPVFQPAKPTQANFESVVPEEELSEVASTTPTTTTTTTTPVPATLSPNLKNKVAWLEKFLRPDGSLNFFKANYFLGENATSPVNQECTTPKSEEGQCKLLKDCEDLHSILVDVISFKDYFCVIENNLAGVCCPKKSN